MADSINQRNNQPPILIPRASVSELVFRIMITGPEDVIPSVAKQLKKYKIAQKLSPTGLHAIIMCVDPSKPNGMSAMNESIKHLDFKLLSTALFIMNIVRPFPDAFQVVTENIKKVSITYNRSVYNVIWEDETSFAFGIERITSAALISSKFTDGYEPLIFKIGQLPDDL